MVNQCSTTCSGIPPARSHSPTWAPELGIRITAPDSPQIRTANASQRGCGIPTRKTVFMKPVRYNGERHCLRGRKTDFDPQNRGLPGSHILHAHRADRQRGRAAASPLAPRRRGFRHARARRQTRLLRGRSFAQRAAAIALRLGLPRDLRLGLLQPRGPLAGVPLTQQQHLTLWLRCLGLCPPPPPPPTVLSIIGAWLFCLRLLLARHLGCSRVGC